jgi:hypothetical protein
MRHVARVVAVLAAAAALAASSTAAALAPNVCRTVGLSNALAASMFGKGATAYNYPTGTSTPPNLGACDLLSPSSARGGLDVELYEPSAFTQLTNFPTSGPAATRAKVTKLTGLGHGAVYAVSGDHGTDGLVFVTAKYTVYIFGSLAGGQPASDYPSEKAYVSLAHTVYPHVR